MTNVATCPYFLSHIPIVYVLLFLSFTPPPPLPPCSCATISTYYTPSLPTLGCLPSAIPFLPTLLNQFPLLFSISNLQHSKSCFFLDPVELDLRATTIYCRLIYNCLLPSLLYILCLIISPSSLFLSFLPLVFADLCTKYVGCMGSSATFSC